MVKPIHPTSMYTSTCINHSSVGQTFPDNPCFYRDFQEIKSWMAMFVDDLTWCCWSQPKWVSLHQVITFAQALSQPKPPHPLPTANPADRKARAVLFPPSVWWDEDEVMRKATNLRCWFGAILPLSLLHEPLVTAEIRLFMKTPHGAFAVNLENLFL